MDDTMPEVNKENLLKLMHDGFAEINAFIESHTPEQLTNPSDEAGWTPKDHIIHMAMWTRGALALLRKESRLQAMGLTRWEDGDVMNDIIKQQHQSIALDDAIQQFRDAHQSIKAQVESMSNDELMLSYKVYDADFDRDAPVLFWVAGNTFQHYAEHQKWMAAIIESTP